MWLDKCNDVVFNDHELEQFVKRMNGRTLEEECELAGITKPSVYEDGKITLTIDEISNRIGAAFLIDCVVFRRWKIGEGKVIMWNQSEAKYFNGLFIFNVFDNR